MEKTNTYNIAKEINREQYRLYMIIEKYIAQFTELGEVKKVKRKQVGRGSAGFHYELNPQQAVFLISLLRNKGDIVTLKLEVAKLMK
jgi:hypothetical protein